MYQVLATTYRHRVHIFIAVQKDTLVKLQASHRLYRHLLHNPTK